MAAQKWLLGITGGIAAYKTPELVRLLKKQGKELRVVLSSGAKSFVTPMSLQAVSGHPVYSELLDCDFEAAMGHIELARWADAILIAPLSANRLAALALGMADDLLTTLCLATKAPIWVAPAMNQAMWHHPATQHNIALLQSRGIQILGPDWGEQACGDVGLGRMLQPEEIVSTILQAPSMLATSSPLNNLSMMITAGPTREPIDPVRYISNRSSGKMGYALAEAACRLGAKVTLISGPVALPTPQGVTRIDVTTAQEMLNAVMAHYQHHPIFISAAAVCDFRVENIAPQKIKKTAQQNSLDLQFIANPDIVKTIASLTDKPFCVGFAAETEKGDVYAKQKLQDKGLDLIAMNDVSQKEIGFDAACNALTVFSHQNTYSIEKAPKSIVAFELLKIIGECYAKNKIKNSRS